MVHPLGDVFQSRNFVQLLQCHVNFALCHGVNVYISLIFFLFSVVVLRVLRCNRISFAFCGTSTSDCEIHLCYN